MDKRVVVTGIGSVSSLGNTIEEMLYRLNNGIDKYERIPDDRFLTDHKLYRNNRGFIMDQELYSSAKKDEPSIMYSIACKCINEALNNALLNTERLEKYRTGLCLGTSVGASYIMMERIKGQVNLNKENYEFGRYTTPIMIGKIARKFRINGTVSTISTACASGTNSIGRGFDLIKNGKEDIMICGGIDIFTELTYSGFNSLMAISKDRCKPLSNEGDGMSLGDACSMLILESYESAKERGARIYGEIKGYYTLNEAYHPTAPHPEGIYAYKCMKNALAASQMDIDDISYINSHGTGTEKNDQSETKSLELLLKNKQAKTYVNSTKGLTGHALGAAGSIEAIICLLSIQNSTIFANGKEYVYPSSEKIEFVNNNKKNVRIDTVMSNSFGFGGNMASVIISNINN